MIENRISSFYLKGYRNHTKVPITLDFCTLEGLRERDVMQKLLESDESMKIVSEGLGISERMLYRYVNSLYEKAGAENRAGLVKRYYQSGGRFSD